MNTTIRIKLTIRLLPSGDEICLGVPDNLTGKEIIDELLSVEKLNIPKIDSDKKTIVYSLSSKETGKQLLLDVSLRDNRIRSGYVLIMVPEKIAG